MFRRGRVIVFVAIIVLGGFPETATSGPKETLAQGDDGNIEFKTLTLTRTEFLAGKKNGKEAVISGYLAFPKADGKRAAIIISHAGGGVGKAEAGWAEELQSMGIATFIVDSYRGRGISGWPSENELGLAPQVLDLYRALALLATHPRIDPQRIGILGVSRGGGLAIAAGLAHFRSAQLPPNVDFAVYLAMYPGLPTGFDFSKWHYPHGRPIRIFQGTDDDWTPVSVARALVEAQRVKDANIKMFEYPRARHGFDNPQFTQQTSVQGHTMQYDGQAHAQAIKDMKATLTEVFGTK